MSVTSPIGAVAIGRNEGEKLRRCLSSLRDRVAPIVYVDSGSSDGSVDLARRVGATVVELDPSIPFTAARARNAGLSKLIEESPGIDLVQFVDGDCEVVPGWLERAADEMRGDPTLAVVCGRRRERHPEASIFNRLCDIEWNTPIGYALTCGGDALMRVQPLREVEGYAADLIAGEEPELCLRLRQRGWRILRLDAEMTLHDAAMNRFDQWWKRTVRAGHAYAEGAARHGREPERHWVHEARSNWFWGAAVPVAALGMAPPSLGLSLGLFGGHALLAARVYRAGRRRGLSASDAGLFAASCVVGKLPQALGQLTYWKNRLLGKRGTIIEYRHRDPTTGPATTGPGGSPG
jgi:GT2 family glycosyltransferase